MKSLFEEIIFDLSKNLDVEMHLDTIGNVTLLIEDKIELTIEYDDTFEKLIIFAPLNELAAGKFRENVLTFALKENNTFDFQFTLGYIESESLLAISYVEDINKLKKEELYKILNNFIASSIFLYDSINSGTIPLIDNEQINNPFNLR
jgi:hypothetical protein